MTIWGLFGKGVSGGTNDEEPRDAGVEAARNLASRFATVGSEQWQLLVEAIAAHAEVKAERDRLGPSQEWWNKRSKWYQGECARLEGQIAELTARLASAESQNEELQETAVYRAWQLMRDERDTLKAERDGETLRANTYLDKIKALRSDLGTARELHQGFHDQVANLKAERDQLRRELDAQPAPRHLDLTTIEGVMQKNRDLKAEMEQAHRAFQHAMHRSHQHMPEGCDGCANVMRVAALTSAPGSEYDD